MNIYLRNLFGYFENVLHPAGGKEDVAEKRKRKLSKNSILQHSPECYNTRAAVIKKQDKSRRNPAP
jgi:hypothetical protein